MDEVALRVGDQDRRAVDARLQHAVGAGQLTLGEYEERSREVWQARTRADLDLVTRDLPAPAPVAAPVRPVRGLRPRRAVAVMSGDELRGPVLPGQPVEAYALMGGAVIDLRREDLPAEVHVRAVAVMGGVEVLVPRGVTVQLSGAALMGGRNVRVDETRPGAPVVHVAGWALMGGVDVKHGKNAPEARAVEPGLPPALDAAPAGLVPVQPLSGSRALAPHRPHRQRGRSFAGIALVAALAGGGAVVASQSDSAAVFGSADHRVVQGQDEVRVGALFGSVQVVVPDDAQVRSGGLLLFGSAECAACDSAKQGPVIEVDRVGAFGSVEVVTESQAAQQAAEERAEEAREEAEERSDGD